MSRCEPLEQRLQVGIEKALAHDSSEPSRATNDVLRGAGRE